MTQPHLPPESSGGDEFIDDAAVNRELAPPTSRREKALRKILAARELEKRAQAGADEQQVETPKKKADDPVKDQVFREKVADKGDGSDGVGKEGRFSRFMPKSWRDKRFWTLVVL